ncbi:hypothetical protein GPJ56_007384 [Histomonas meleagridis]|uniref:uncharacterized protein n=1 Tax=Histomonas meleagridis TaxID=135588 RepID=UPI0035593BB7|nr:hypothetical protein GPJ56_007384 [Histomonas meleagridis]KAH0804230.1 hypothetical protein GO595_003060 [Histomonas meleagridis]
MSSSTTTDNTINHATIDELKKELEVLKKERQKSIENCEFSKTRAIDCHIDRLKKQIETTTQDNKSIENELQFQLKKEEIQLHATNYLKAAREAVFEIKREYQQRKIYLHQVHTEELIKFANNYSAALELEVNRNDPTSAHLKKQAQYNAKARNYSEAERLYNESVESRSKSSAKRQEDLQRAFEKNKEVIEQRHRREDQLCEEKEKKALELEYANFDKVIAKLECVLKKAALNLGLKLTDNDLLFLKQYKIDEDFPTIINTPKKVPTPKRTPTRSPKTPRSTNVARSFSGLFSLSSN